MTGIMCVTCGGPLSKQGKIYCSWQCSNGRSGTRAGSRTARPCEICGQQFKAKGSGRTVGYVQRTCSRACGVELRYRNGSLNRRTSRLSWTYIRKCRCGGYFATVNARQVFCSSQCRNERRCSCGVVLAFKRMLCDACREEHQRQAKRQEHRRRRALKRGVSTEPYTIAEIAARDRYRCGFCRKQVAMTKIVPHPKSPVIDHIIPLADGGDDTRANVQLAHFICNSLAGATGIKQAALFG